MNGRPRGGNRAGAVYRYLALMVIVVLTVPPPPAAAYREERRDAYGFLRLPRERAERLRELQQRIDRDNHRLQERLEERREDLEELYRRYRVDERRSARLRQEIRQTQYELLDLHHRFQTELRTILTEDEFERLQRRLREAQRRRRDRD
jgi:hypothetical protein